MIISHRVRTNDNINDNINTEFMNNWRFDTINSPAIISTQNTEYPVSPTEYNII